MISGDKKIKVYVVLFVCFAFLSMINAEQVKTTGAAAHTLDYFKEHAEGFSESALTLRHELQELDPAASGSIAAAKQALLNCRMEYKRIEFFLNYFLPSTSLIYNAPANVEVEVPFMEYREPTGLQVMETLLFDPDPVAHKGELLEQADLIASSASDLPSLLFDLKISDPQVLESLRISLIGLMSLGLSGFDAPELKSGIPEAAQSLMAISTVLRPYLEQAPAAGIRLRRQLDFSLKLLSNEPDFDAFDRASFLKDAGLPLLKELDAFISASGMELNTSRHLNYKAASLFSKGALFINSSTENQAGMAELGRKLFFEKALSGNQSRSCATCHRPEKYFTDVLPKALAMDNQSNLPRNTPSLFYSALQHSQFLDGRAPDLPTQIREVLRNPLEMDGSDDKILKFVNQNLVYRSAFNQAFPKALGEPINMDRLSTAIAAFLQTLAPFESPFDRYMRGEKQALSTAQVKGFNLFMGKAQCGTCHFMPVFNGLTPPLYDRTDLEIIGLTKDANFDKPVLDADRGRYKTFPIEYFMAAFKTPTLRNVAKTAPYMHNGMFPDLESVLEFYNKGGGAGMGLEVSQQTLSSRPLNLTKREIAQVIAFLESLTDPPVKSTD